MIFHDVRLFNGSGSSLSSRTRIKTLAYETIVANARFFDNDINKVPKVLLFDLLFVLFVFIVGVMVDIVVALNHEWWCCDFGKLGQGYSLVGCVIIWTTSFCDSLSNHQG